MQPHALQNDVDLDGLKSFSKELYLISRERGRREERRCRNNPHTKQRLPYGEGKQLFFTSPRDKQHNDELKMQQVRSRLHNRKSFATVRIEKHCEQIIRGICRVFISGDCRVCWKKLPRTTRGRPVPLCGSEVASWDPSCAPLRLHAAV